MEAQPIVLILGAGQREYREYMFDKLSRRYRLVLISPDPLTWESKYVIDHVEIDPSDSERIIAAAEELARERELAGVLTYYEPCVELAARIGRNLGLPHCLPVAARRCRDKLATRRALREAGVPSAAYAMAESDTEARQAAEDIGYPVIVKPRSLSASFGVTMVVTPDQLDAALATVRSSVPTEPWYHYPGILVEEYLDGPEISIDSVVHNGAVTPVVYARKVLGFAPNFVEVGHIVADAAHIVDDPDTIVSVLVAAHRALQIDHGVTHSEIRLTATGPRIIEINGRAGGGLIPQLGELATGVDLATASGDIAVGRKPHLTPTLDRVAGVRFFYPPRAGEVVGCGLPAAFENSDWVHQITWMFRPGMRVGAEQGRLYVDRLGFGVVTTSSVEECVARMDELSLSMVAQMR